MTVVHKLILMALLAITTAAILAPGAAAQGVEVSQEPGGEHCSEATCAAHAVNTTPVVMELFGDPVSVCSVELTALVEEDGTGEFVDQTLGGPNCGLEPCADTHWPFNISEAGADTYEGEMDFCVQSPLFGVVDCHLVSIGVVEDLHNGELVKDASPCEGLSGVLHITGSFTLETSDYEIDHAS